MKSTSPEFGPSTSVQTLFYDRFFAPYLSPESDRSFTGYFLQESFKGWMLSVSAAELNGMAFVAWMAKELYIHHSQDFLQVLSYVLDESYETHSRTGIAEALVKNAKNGDKSDQINAKLSLYKTYFENEFRLWITVPFMYSVRFLNVKHSSSDLHSLANLAGGKKYQQLKNLKAVAPQGDMKRLLQGFDNQVRNCGAGHDRWELTDDDLIILRNVDPDSGEVKKDIHISFLELDRLIDECRKTLWVLRNGLYLFLANHPHIRTELSRIKPLKRMEIEAHVRNFARERLFNLTDFKLNDARTEASLTLQHHPIEMGDPQGIILSNGRSWDLIAHRSPMSYDDQAVGVVQYLLHLLDSSKVRKLELEVLNESGARLGRCIFEPEQISALETPNLDVDSLVVAEGNLPKGTYDFVHEIRLPPGTRKRWEQLGLSEIEIQKQMEDLLRKAR